MEKQNGSNPFTATRAEEIKTFIEQAETWIKMVAGQQDLQVNRGELVISPRPEKEDIFGDFTEEEIHSGRRMFARYLVMMRGFDGMALGDDVVRILESHFRTS